jgi:hypothetical protein
MSCLWVLRALGRLNLWTLLRSRNVVTRSLKCSDTSRMMLLGGERFTGLLKAGTEQLPPTAVRQMWNCQRRAENVTGPPIHAGDSACLTHAMQGYEDKQYTFLLICLPLLLTSPVLSFPSYRRFSSPSASPSRTLSSTSPLLCCPTPYLHVLSSVLYLDFTLLFLRFPLSLFFF